MFRTNRLVAVLGFSLCLAHTASAATIGYWRMEADLDPTSDLRVANEVSGSDLLSSNAFIDTNLPTTSVPQTGQPNLGSIGSISSGNTDGINATAAAYAALNVSSITIEFWARTVESTAELFIRSTGSNGIIIDQPSDLRVRWWVDDGAGGAVERSMSGLFDMTENWNHFAFSYDHVTGRALMLVDGATAGIDNGVANRALIWDPNADVQLGFRMDFAAANNGTLDEVRIDDIALGQNDLLINPEPSTGLLLSMGLVGIGMRRQLLRAR